METLPPSLIQGLAPAKPEEAKKDELGQEDFLTLMVAQIQNQDPFKPLESGEFLGQLAQFGTVSGIQALQGSVEQLAGSLQSMQALQASSLVGKEVLIQGAQAYLQEGGVIEGKVDIPLGTTALTVSIYDESGELVRRIPLGEQPPGRMDFQWDGMTDGEEPAPEGVYRVALEATVDGQPVSLDPALRAHIESVSLGGGQGMTLNLAGLGSLGIDQVLEIF